MSFYSLNFKNGQQEFMWVWEGLAWTRTDPDGPGRTRLGSAGFYYTDVFNDRLLGANLQLVPGCHTLAA